MQGARLQLATVLAVVAAVALSAAETATAADRPTDLPAAAWVLVDAEDGTVLAAHRANSERSIASTTKLMTAFVSRRELRPGEIVTAAPYDALPAESLLGLETGESIEVRDLLYGLLLVSGNDAAETLAVAAAGSRERFVEQMNAAATRLGLDHTSYANPVGLDEAGNYSSARDLTTLAIRLRRDALFRKIFDTATITIQSGAHSRSLTNRNNLVLTVPYVDGVKTGYTIDAGNVLVGSGEQKNVELISAVLGAPTESERDAATLALLDYGFSLYRQRAPVKQGQRLAVVSIRDRNAAVGLEAAEPVRVTVRRGEEVETRIDAPTVVDGPLRRGEQLGTATVIVGGEEQAEVALVASESADAASLTERVDAKVPGPRIVTWIVAIAGVSLLIAAALALRARSRR